MKAKCVKIEKSSVIRKFICMAIVFIILVGDFLLPAEILATENYYNEMESTIVTNENTSASENESVKSNSDNLEYNEKNQKQGEQENQEDGGNLSNENKQLFNNLDEETENKKFLYAERSYNINILTAAMPGLQKLKFKKELV